MSYRCLKHEDGVTYCHLAAAVDDGAVNDLKRKEFFKPYSAKGPLKNNLYNTQEIGYVLLSAELRSSTRYDDPSI